MNSELEITDLKLYVNIGLFEFERKNKQVINVDISMKFKEILAACIDDKISNTICYDNLIEEINIFLENKEFSLLEHFCYIIFEFVLNKIESKFSKELFKLKIKTTKYPNINNLKSSSFIVKNY